MQLAKSILQTTLALSVFLVEPVATQAEQNPFYEELFADDNLLIVDMRLNNYVLAEDIFIYANQELALVPLQAFFDAIEFPILVDTTNNTAEGWYLTTDREFLLDLNKSELTLGDLTNAISTGGAIYNDGIDIYVDIALLEQWFPIELELKLSQLRLSLEPKEKLPIQKRIEREKQRERIAGAAKADLPIIADQYRWINWPVVDVSLGSNVQLRQTSEDRGADVSYFVQSSGDLLKMQSSFLFSRQTLDNGSNARFSLHRKQAHPDKPLYSELNSIALGDIFSVSDPLIFTSGSGLGVDLQFGEERTLSDFGKKSIEGFATPGWEIEVYRNNVLLDFQTVSDDGRYRFDDLPLEYGENVFDIRLFGPQGQEETRRETLNIGDKALPKNAFYTRLHYSNINESVFSAAPSFSGEEDSDRTEQYGYLTHERGISNNLSLAFVAAEHANPDDASANRNYLGAGLAYTFLGVALNAQRLSQLGEGNAYSLGLQTRVGNTSVSFNHKLYNQFSSERSDSGRIKEDVELRFNSYIGKLFSAPLTHQLLLNYEQATDRQYLLTVENRFGFNALGGRINWDNIYNTSRLDSFNTGSLRYLRTAGVRLNLRGSLQYDTTDGFEVVSLATTWNWHPNRDWNLQITTNTDFSGGDNNALAFSSARKFSSVLLSLDASVNEGGGGFIGLNAEFSLSRHDRSWHSLPNRQANFGRMRTQVFLDHDGNKAFSHGDEPLRAVQFEGINAWRELETNHEGTSYLTQFRSSTESRIKLDKGSFEDPFWQSEFDEARVVSHPGGLIDLPIPVVETLEIEGSIQIEDAGQLRPLPGIPLILTSLNGDVVQTTVSEFDGYFVINAVLPGSYRLSIHPEALKKLGLTNVKHTELRLKKADGVVYIDPITLNRR